MIEPLYEKLGCSIATDVTDTPVVGYCGDHLIDHNDVFFIHHLVKTGLGVGDSTNLFHGRLALSARCLSPESKAFATLEEKRYCGCAKIGWYCPRQKCVGFETFHCVPPISPPLY